MVDIIEIRKRMANGGSITKDEWIDLRIQEFRAAGATESDADLRAFADQRWWALKRLAVALVDEVKGRRAMEAQAS